MTSTMKNNRVDHVSINSLANTLPGNTNPGNGNKPNLVALVPRGEVIRNFIYSNAFEYAARETNVSLISVSPNKQMSRSLSKAFGGMHPLQDLNENWVVRFQREIIELAHGRWLWSRAAAERWRLRDLEARTASQKFKRLAKKAVSFPFSSRKGLRLLSYMERTSSHVFRNNQEYELLLKRLNPSLVFNGSHIHSKNAIQVVQAAQWLGIPTATFVFSWDNLTSQGRITLPYDYFIVWNDELKTQLLEMYEWIKPAQVFVTGTPQFDFHFRPEFYIERKKFFEKIGADPDRPLVLYSTGMANHMPGEQDIVEQIADLLAEIEGKPQLLVRVYPKDRTGRFDELKQRRDDIIFPKIAWEESWSTPEFEDCYDLVNTLRYVDFGINIASTISLELCMFDKPVINVGYNPESVSTKEVSFADYYLFDHYKPVVESGAVEVARTVDEMRALITQAISDPSRNSAARKRLINKMFNDTLDGRSAQRISEVLINISNRSKT